MRVQSLASPDGLSPAEVAQLIVFAARADLPIETGTTEDGSPYAALYLGAFAGMNDTADTWIVSREKGRVVAFNERLGLLPHRKSVPDLLKDLARLLPANESTAPELRFGA